MTSNNIDRDRDDLEEALKKAQEAVEVAVDYIADALTELERVTDGIEALKSNQAE